MFSRVSKRHTGSGQPEGSLYREMTYWNEQIRHLSFIFFPSLTILGRTLLDVSVSSMQNHRREERSVEPWKWAVETSDKAPRQCLVDTVSQDRQRESGGTHKIQITSIVYFASLSICQIYQRTVHTQPLLNIHQPSARRATPWSVGIVFGLSMSCHGS